MQKPKPQTTGQINFIKRSILSHPGTPRYYQAGSLVPGAKLPVDRQGKQYIVGEHNELRLIKHAN